MKKKHTNRDATIDIPEVKDIPGQEHVRPPHIGEMADTTASSAGEEGEGILDELDQPEDDIIAGEDNVSLTEKELLASAERPLSDETKDVANAVVDKVDEEDELHEQPQAFDMGEDLDIPGSELDDDNEEIGEEDEENNAYSRND